MSRAKKPQADVAQLAEHLICNQAVASSTLAVSSVGMGCSRERCPRHDRPWARIGGVPKRPTGADCKSAGFTPSKVRILPPPLTPRPGGGAAGGSGVAGVAQLV